MSYHLEWKHDASNACRVGYQLEGKNTQTRKGENKNVGENALVHPSLEKKEAEERSAENQT